mmetsp:Transcript_1099/g.1508  ORF Transcript_1099/g.1508 Transcript_1099/m.1508 type:complete len:1130 (-) Transcript_1099:52-3441(-)
MERVTGEPTLYGSIDNKHGIDVDVEEKESLEFQSPLSPTLSSSYKGFRLFSMASAFLVAIGVVQWKFLSSPATLSSEHNHHEPLSLVSKLGQTWLFPRRSKSSLRRTTTTATPIPFEHINREAYGSVPAKDVVDINLFDPSLRGDKSKQKLLNVPFPTGAFWTNFVLRESTTGMGFSYPIMAYPYAYKWSSSMIQLSYPPLHRMLDEISIRDIFQPEISVSVVEHVKDRHVKRWDPLSVTLRYTAGQQQQQYWETALVQGSPYITISYQDVTPAVTALSIFKEFKCLPSDSKDKNSCFMEEDEQSKMTLKGKKFMIRTNENLIWILFASEPICLTFDKIQKNTIISKTKFTGVLRLALVPPDQDPLTSYTSQTSNNYKSLKDDDDIAISSGVIRLECHANTYPVGGKTTWDFHNQKKGDVATVHFEYDVKAMEPSATKQSSKKCDADSFTELLIMALPHHAQVLDSSKMLQSKDKFDLTFRSIKGTMVPVVGNTWSYDEPLTSIGFESKSALQNAASLPLATKRTIMNQVKKDMYIVHPTLDENVYGFGKQAARLAQLAHIASVLEEEDSSSVTIEICQSLHKPLSAYLSGQTVDKLLFDNDFGGIVSKNGLLDLGDDFGNGWYNDHLFHYGYILYASAVLGNLNSTFVEEYGDAVDALMFDVANSAHSESPEQTSGNNIHAEKSFFPFFKWGDNKSESISDDDNAVFLPFTRHKSWFDSHSFASGLFPFADGKSMESSAESINCYYGTYLWSSVRWGAPQKGNTKKISARNAKEDSNMVDFARLLLAMEIRGVKTYWHMVNPTDEVDTHHAMDIYNPAFAKHLMVGNVGMMDVTVATWFGTSPLYVHMINFLPITAVTREVFSPSYVEKEFHDIMEPVYASVEKAWKGYVICDRAMIDPNGAWDDALQLRSFELDQAISQSQVLYFVSTTDGFDPPAGKDVANDADQNEDSYKTCSEHSACLALGLIGECCPAPNGAHLGCCTSAKKGIETEKKDKEDTKTTTGGTIQKKGGSSTDNVSSNLCVAYKACAALGLLGECCPTSDGAYLGCCGNDSSTITSNGSNSEMKKTDNSPPPPPPRAHKLPLPPATKETLCSGKACCSKNQACADLGLSGQCCPTQGGNMLGCCK